MTPSPLLRGSLITTATLTVLAVLLWVALAKPFATEGTHVTADFGRAGQGLSEGSPVKVRGVQVGTVEAVRLGKDGRAHLTLVLDPGTRVPVTAVAAITPASVFGPKFVDLVPGADETRGPFLASGGVLARTADPADLADVLASTAGTVGAVDPAEVAVLVHALAEGLAGQGPTLRKLLMDSETIVGVAHKHRNDARRFLRDGADLAETFAATAPTALRATGDAQDVITTVASAGRGNLGAFASGLGDVSALVAYGLDRRGGQIGTAFRSSERLVALLYGQLGPLSDGIRAANGLLPVYNDLAKLPASGGEHFLGVAAYLPSNPCDLILGLCGGR